jgi:hypothetical protein
VPLQIRTGGDRYENLSVSPFAKVIILTHSNYTSRDQLVNCELLARFTNDTYNTAREYTLFRSEAMANRSGLLKIFGMSASQLSKGVLFLTAAAILFGTKPAEVEFHGVSIPIMPTWSYTALGIIAIIVSVLFMTAVFCKPIAEKMKEILDDKENDKELQFWKRGIRLPYWMILWFVCTIGWLKALVLIPTGNASSFQAILWVGFLWSIVIFIVWMRELALFVYFFIKRA